MRGATGKAVKNDARGNYEGRPFLPDRLRRRLRCQSGVGDFGPVFEPADIVSTARDSNVFRLTAASAPSAYQLGERLRWQS
jgi:hypothetical protein